MQRNGSSTLELAILLRRAGRASDKQLRTYVYFKEKKDFIVEENKRNELNAKLKEMIKEFDQAETKRNKPITLSGTGNAIRRREGQKDRRFSV